VQDARSRNPDILPADDAEATRTAEQPHPYDRSTTFIPAPADLKEGQIFGAYRLVRRLGQGGFGEVWEAEHQRTKRLLALKVLIAARQRSPEAVERFEREGKLAASVSHPRCVFVFGAEEIAGYPVITMELMRGGTLRDRVSSQGPMPPQQAVDSILDIIEGLEAAHRAGLLHRDVKPSNCFLDETGRAKIGDFGISKALEDQSDLTITGTFVGTPSYAAPEQVRGLEVGIQSDIYAVGATLYTLLTGAPPFKGHNAADVFGRVIAEPPAPFATYSVQVPGSLERVVLRAMAKDKARRFQSYEEFRNALVSFSSSRPAMASVGRRVFAYYVDLLPFFALMNWLAGPARTAWGGATFQDVSRSPTLLSLVPFATAASLFFLYLTLTERCWNRTVGKYLMAHD
jgi:serine/threonine protein kinase